MMTTKKPVSNNVVNTDGMEDYKPETAIASTKARVKDDDTKVDDTKEEITDKEDEQNPIQILWDSFDDEDKIAMAKQVHEWMQSEDGKACMNSGMSDNMAGQKQEN